MKPIVIVVSMAALILAVGCKKEATEPEVARLSGAARDLWGSQIDLSNFNHGLTLVEPYSPST